MQAADDLVMLKRLVRAQARRHGVTACFMAKPIDDYAGSGMHFHVSLMDETGANIFIEERRRSWSPPLLNALGGLMATMAESMLVFAPHANSWRRFVSQSYAPVAPTWGVNNRSVALRIPAGDAKKRRIEHRPSGVDANPYLVAATVLAGIAKASTKARPRPGNHRATAMRTRRNTGLPTDWRSAIEAAKASAFLKKALGDDLHRTFTAIKEAEYLRVARTVSELDYHLVSARGLTPCSKTRHACPKIMIFAHPRGARSNCRQASGHVRRQFSFAPRDKLSQPFGNAFVHLRLFIAREQGARLVASARVVIFRPFG